MDKLTSKTMDLEKQNIELMKKMFPSIVKEGKINFEQLRLLLGDEVDDSREKYQFTWKGKINSIKIANTPSNATLLPCKNKSKNWDNTDNLYIEGDNLEVLKQLQKTYHGKIKLIYIDPPYNTGTDFVYNDSFTNSISNYKKQTSQEYTSNPESNGRFHSDWLNMIYPRIMLSKNLLTDDGVVFISIDDHEQENLKKICNEIFGENNFIAQVIWERAYSPVNLKKHFSECHDYILCYAKNKEQVICNGLPRSEEANNRYGNPDNDPRGVWQSDNATVGPAVEERIYEIITPNGRKIMPPNGRCWLYSKDRFQEMIEDNRIWFGEDGNNVPRIKRFLSDVKQGMTPMTLWKYSEVGHSQDAAQKLKKLFDGKSYFDYPKSVELIKRCIQLYTDKESYVLDFFSGSSTTAHAVMKLNSEDNGKRKYIMVQWPEKTDEKSEAFKDGYKSICDIGEDRIRRAGEQIKNEWLKDNVNNEQIHIDLGFKVFKLESTNINEWDNNNTLSEQDLFSNLNDVFKSDRSNIDILYEVMLKYGIFNQETSEIEINGKKMYVVGRNYMLVCLEDEVNNLDIDGICKLKPRCVVFKESGFKNDNDKINAVYNLEKAGIEDIKCI